MISRLGAVVREKYATRQVVRHIAFTAAIIAAGSRLLMSHSCRPIGCSAKSMSVRREPGDPGTQHGPTDLKQRMERLRRDKQASAPIAEPCGAVRSCGSSFRGSRSPSESEQKSGG